MPKKQLIGVVVSDKMAKSRRVEIPRLVKHPKYGKYVRRRTVCYVHDEKDVSKMGDSVEIIECPPKSKNKRWELLRVVSESRLVDLAAMRAAAKIADADVDGNVKIAPNPEPAETTQGTPSGADSKRDGPDNTNNEAGETESERSEEERGEGKA